ncbi:MAG: hypothetical protein U0002_07155 [Thermoanaerobaculia bacterium]
MRTTSPYFSPNRAIAPAAIALLPRALADLGGQGGKGALVHPLLDLGELLGGQRPVEVVEAEPLGATSEPARRALLAQNAPQRRMQQVGGGVMALDRRASLRVQGLVEYLPRF